MRNLARNGLEPPAGFMAPKAWRVLADFYQQNQSQSDNINNQVNNCNNSAQMDQDMPHENR